MKKTKLAKSISLSCITVSDIKKAKHLFVDLLGLDLKDDNEFVGWMELAGKDDKTARLGVGVYREKAMDHDEDLKPGQNGIISFEVDNIVEAKKHLEANNIKFCGEIMEIPDEVGEVKLALFKDSDGNRFFLAQKD